MILAHEYLPYPWWFPHLVNILVFGGTAAILIWYNLRQRQYQIKGIPVRGHVLQHVWTEPDRDGKSNKIVEMGFETLTGESIVGTPNFFTFSGKLPSVGSVLLVKYMPDDPKNFILSNTMSIYLSVSTTVFFIIVFVFLFGANYVPGWMPIAVSALSVFRVMDVIVRRKRERRFLSDDQPKLKNG